MVVLSRFAHEEERLSCRFERCVAFHLARNRGDLSLVSWPGGTLSHMCFLGFLDLDEKAEGVFPSLSCFINGSVWIHNCEEAEDKV